MLSLATLSWALLLLQPCSANQGIAHLTGARKAQEQRLAQFNEAKKPNGTSSGNGSCTEPSCYRYHNSKTAPYLVESLPEVDFKLGELYGGSVAIDSSDKNRTLFFMFKPSETDPVDEVTIWLNGGPGCSSLVGFFQENGPYLWQPGTAKPVKNDFAWSEMTNVLWVDQPVGAGFAQGKVTATNEVDVAKDFVSFFKNFQTLFGIKNYKIYVTGESYAGRYVPYIGAQMLDQNNTEYFDLKGAIVYDPCIGDCGLVQMEYPIAAFASANNELLNLDQATINKLNQMSDECGYTDYLNKYLSFPPPGHQPPTPAHQKKGCGTGNVFTDAASNVNPCYNVYHIADFCPYLFDPLTNTATPYFNRMDVKKAIHAPLDVTWSECANDPVFVKGNDESPDSIISALPQVIEATNRVLVANADWDALIPNNGTLLAIQNMTWNGKQGFQTKPTALFEVPIVQGQPAQGPLGIQHFERGLAWATTEGSGHMQPEYQPAATWVHLQWLLGRIQNL